MLTELYNLYENGKISECEYKGETVYIAGINAYDAASKVYNSKGEVIGTCNYAFGQVDDICRQLKNCEVIYRCENHISGEPAVDNYGIGEK